MLGFPHGSVEAPADQSRLMFALILTLSLIRQLATLILLCKSYGRYARWRLMIHSNRSRFAAPLNSVVERPLSSKLYGGNRSA